MANELRLTVVRSTIDGKGIAKLDSTSFERMKLSEGAKVIVKYGTKSKEMVARCDPIYCESTARLMAFDMDFLRVQPGSQVTVTKKGGSKQAKPKAPAEKKGKRKAKPRKAASLDSF